MSKRSKKAEELKFFEVLYIYKEAFSPDWSHQPGLKVNFTRPSGGKPRPLVPVGGSNRD
jgi:hypothetical protein